MPARLLLAVAAAASGVAFLLCALDKSRAGRGAPRVAERSLLAWAAVGGSPGLFAGMVLWRHKVRKASFLARLLLVALLQLAAALAWARFGPP